MIITKTNNNTLELTEKALMIDAFKRVLNKYKDDEELGMSFFSIMYFMYSFDSYFLYKFEEDEKQRLKEVKKFVYRGEEIKMQRIEVAAMEVYKELYETESAKVYIILKKNLEKLKNYANNMVLVRPEEEELNNGTSSSIYVDSKEFTNINTLLPKQQEELDKFEIKVIENIQNKIDIYGGGDLGAYE